jgi:hypothetical protein
MNKKTDCTNVQIGQLNVDVFFPIRNIPFFLTSNSGRAQVNNKKTRLSLTHTWVVIVFRSLSFNCPHRQSNLRHDQTEAPSVPPPRPGVPLHSDQRQEL